MLREARGLNYIRFFRRMFTARNFDWYLEIGCRGGRILSQCKSKSIGVDPVFRLGTDVLGEKPELHLFQEESDTFFEKNRLVAMGARVSVTFIDGMHLVENVLRDVINTEKNSDPNGVIFVHDCFPFNDEMTTRDLNALPKVWTGDVWKIVPILREYRPDLTLTALDAAPTGLLVISRLDPENTTLLDAYDQILARYRNQTLETYGRAKFADTYQFESTRDEISNEFKLVAKVSRPHEPVVKPAVITP
ncbi:hypothetical protein [Ruegeria arenilitoris]|uniref:hypothetical protein n=1 Tax=Ruegeria arenilitoris TaxID=1173585 RepID=UPI0014819AA7|nr:hypothetical protein [Ruegeria arenilitoris]